MSEERHPVRPSMQAGITNWQNSELPFFERLAVALGNYSRRFRIPPRNCCDNLGQPGC